MMSDEVPFSRFFVPLRLAWADFGAWLAGEPAADYVVHTPSVLTDECASFVLELMGVELSELEAFCFFFDWCHLPPRSFAERLYDLGRSRLRSDL